MGNCLYSVDFSTAENSSASPFEGNFSIEWNYSYGDGDYNGLDAAAPCYSCKLLDRSSLPFFVLTGVLGILLSAAVLFALLRPLFDWQLCPGRQVLIQLAAGSALFSVVVPILTPGLSGAHNTYLCHLAHLVWYGSAFAQALLIGCRACLGPRLGAGRVPGFTLRLTVGLWGVAFLLGLPLTLATDTSNGLCNLSLSQGAVRILHTAACFSVFVLLPLCLLGAKGLTKALGRGPYPWVDILWLWFAFWWLHGVLWGLDSLVRFRLLVLSSCPIQKTLDLLLQLGEALAMLHCVAAPLLLALSCRQAIRTFPAGWASQPDTLAGKL